MAEDLEYYLDMSRPLNFANSAEQLSQLISHFVLILLQNAKPGIPLHYLYTDVLGDLFSLKV